MQRAIKNAVMTGFLLLFVIVFAVSTAGQSTAYFEASEPDESGVFTLTFSLEDVRTLAFEFAVRYDKTAVMPVNAKGEEAAAFEGFSEAQTYDTLMFIGEELNKEAGYFVFTGFANPGAKESAHFADKCFVAAEKTPVYTFSFRKISDADPAFSIASAFDGGVYHEAFPEGALVSAVGNTLIPTEVKTTYNGNTATSMSQTVYYEQTHPRNYTKEQRLKNTVYLAVNDYASAVDGVLKAIDPANRDVRPYEKDGTRYYPFRFVAENLGYTVGWDEETQNATFAKGDNSGYVPTANGDPNVEVVHDRTMVTAEVLWETLGVSVYTGDGYSVVYDSLVAWDETRDAEKEALSAMQYVLMPFFRMFI